MFRALAAGAGLAMALTAAAGATDAQVDFDRPGGAYISLPAASATACAGQCTRDALCLAWTFQPSLADSCALKAVVTPAHAARGVTSGLAARAAGFAALVGADRPAPEPAAAPQDIRPPAAALAQAPRQNAQEELLGGPNDAL